MKESSIVRNIMAYLHGVPGMHAVRKLADRFARGLPDVQAIWVCHGALVLIELEVKTSTGTLSPIQAHHMEREHQPIRQGRYVRQVVRSVEEVQAIVIACMQGAAENDHARSGAVTARGDG